MTNACPILPPEQRRAAEIIGQAKDDMMRKVHAALTEAAEQVRVKASAAGLPPLPPQDGFLASTIHQHMYCTLCGADADTFVGGDPNMALAIIRNSQMIARHYWGADIEPLPQS